MRNPCEAGKVIKRILSNADSINERVKGGIYPIVAPTEKMPCIVYKKASASPASTKDGRSYDEFTFEVSAACKTYTEMVDLSGLIMDALDGFSGEVEGLRVKRISLTDAADLFDSDAYVQSMTYKVKIMDNSN